MLKRIIALTALIMATLLGATSAASAAEPTIDSISPLHGTTAGGTVVTIDGVDLTGATAVTFDGTTGTDFTVVSDSQVTVRAPAHAPGLVSIVVEHPDGDAIIPDIYEYQTYSPSITSLTPSIGSTDGGYTITINGSNFTGVTSVKFGPLDAPEFDVISDSAIEVVVPPSPFTGDADVTVKNADGTSHPTAGAIFLYKEKKVQHDDPVVPPTNPTPVVPQPTPVVPEPTPVVPQPAPVVSVPVALPQVTVSPTQTKGPEVPSAAGLVAVPNMQAVCPLGAGPCNASNVALNAVLPGKKGRVVTLGHDWFKVAAGETKGITAKLSNQGKRLLAKYKKLTVTVLVTVRNADTGAEAIQAKTITLKAPTVNKHNRKG